MMTMEDEKKIRDHSVTKVVESTLISIAASVPVASSLAAGWNEYKNHKQAENIEAILTDFANSIEEMDESKLDKDFFSL